MDRAPTVDAARMHERSDPAEDAELTSVCMGQLHTAEEQLTKVSNELKSAQVKAVEAAKEAEQAQAAKNSEAARAAKAEADAAAAKAAADDAKAKAEAEVAAAKAAAANAKTTSGTPDKASATDADSKKEKRNPWYTKQTCYLTPDDMEVCVYDGPVCMSDAYGGPVLMSVPKRESNEYFDDTETWCPDARWLHKTYADCAGRHERPNLPEYAYKNPEEYARTVNVPPYPMDRRSWGPDERLGWVLESPAAAIVAGTSEADLKKLGPEWVEGAKEIDTSWLPNAGDELGVHSWKRPESVTWLDGATYLIALKGEWFGHIWHWSTGAFGLFAAKRNNETVYNVPKRIDGKMQPGPMNYVLGGANKMPPMDNVVVYGGFGFEAQFEDMPGWQKKIWPIMTQNHTKTWFNKALLAEPYNLSKKRWLCSTRAVIPSYKPYLFTGFADAHAFRLHAYSLAGVRDIKAMDKYPSHTVTILNRLSRGLHNIDAIEAVVKESGMPYKIVNDMGALSWEEQVQLMANTGVLITPHGAQLTNVIFMPVNSVAIEIFPYMMHATMYRKLAEQSGLIYYRLRSTPPMDDPAYVAFKDQEFIDNCENPSHVNSADGYANGHCVHRAKWTQPHPDINEFKMIYNYALDDIGCRDAICVKEIKDPVHNWVKERKYIDMRKEGGQTAA